MFQNCGSVFYFCLYLTSINTFAHSDFGNPISISNDVPNDSLVSSETETNALCNLNTSQLIAHYGYQSETYQVTTKDGYILTLFRCKSKTVPTIAKKVVILFHGILSSSDDYTANIPSQALAYVLADAGYDVWLPNVRGNTYSLKHITKNPDDSSSDFWDFSWDTIGFYDYPAIFDFILQKTNTSKAYAVAHSQGTSSFMAFLSQRPEYNAKVAAASLLAPVGYLNNSAPLYEFLGAISPMLQGLENLEILPKSPFSDMANLLCEIDETYVLCNSILNFLFGPSKNQRNNTMLTAIACHNPNGASTNQFLHFADGIRSGYFGPLNDSESETNEFDLSKITAPITLHYSPNDAFTNPIDVHRLILKLNNSLSDVQVLDHVQFNHIDFLWGIHASTIVYPNILQFFSKH